jgi:Na+/H+ antiporter
VNNESLLLFLLVLGLVSVPLGERLRVPSPVVATVFGMILALPGETEFEFPPELILPLVLPPLLFTAAQNSSWRRFAQGWRPIFGLAVALVFVTTAAVAFVASRIHPALPLGAAVVLGAVCAPPDPAAVSAIARRLGLSRRIVTLLEGEGLFNDVTALTIYQVAVAGVLTGSLSWWGAAGSFAYSALAGIGIGLVNAFVFSWLADKLGGANLRAGLSLIIPYAAYLSAESARASGVMAVLVAAFWLGARNLDPDDVEGRLYGRPFWEVIELLITGFTFGLVGVEFIGVVRELGMEVFGYLPFALLICLTLVIVRFLWMFAAGFIIRARNRTNHNPDLPGNWREIALVSWAGMRAVVTVATALALPSSFPSRTQIIFVAAVVALFTLLVPGMTLPWLVRKLNLATGGQRSRIAEREMAVAAADAAAAHLAGMRAAGQITGEQEDYLSVWFRAMLTDPDGDDQDTRFPKRQTFLRVRGELLAAARAETLARRTHEPEAADELLRRLDLYSASG